MEFRKYLESQPLPKKSLEVTKQEGNTKEGIPNFYQVDNRTIQGVTLGPKAEGRAIKGEGKRKGYSLPGANKAIRGYVGRDDLKAGGSKRGWDKDDIHWFDWLRGVRPDDIKNAELTDQLQLLEEKYPPTRFAGQAIRPQWGDIQYVDAEGKIRDTVQDRIKRNQEVKKLRISEPNRVRNEIGAAKREVESDNRELRAEDMNNLRFDAAYNERIDNNKLQKFQLDANEQQREFDNNFKQDQETQRRLEYEQGRRDNLLLRRQQIEENQKNYEFKVRQYEDMLERSDEREEREDQRYLMNSIKDAVSSLGAFF